MRYTIKAYKQDGHLSYSEGGKADPVQIGKHFQNLKDLHPDLTYTLELRD